MLCTMFLVGKLAGQQVDEFSLPAGSTCSSLVHLQEKLSSHQFLVESRASISVFPAPASSSASSVKLLTADVSSVSSSCVQVPESFLYVLVPVILTADVPIGSAIIILCF